MIEFVRLSTIDPDILIAHMADPKVRAHLPLLTDQWGQAEIAEFVAAKEACWQNDGLGHWGILSNGTYVGWGGFQKEGNEWDFGLVLTSDAFGLGFRILRHALDYARHQSDMTCVTFLLPETRHKLAALKRIGAVFKTKVTYQGIIFQKYSLLL